MPICHSTNDVLFDRLQENHPEGTIVITSNQTAGKGQRGNSWLAEPGKNLTFSLLLYPKFLWVSQQFYLNISICLSLTETITKYTPKKVTIKWPNDIYIEDRKVCGVLFNNQVKGDVINSSIVGIGLNVNQGQFQGFPATSLTLESSLEEFDPEKILFHLCKNIERRYLLLRNMEFGKLKQEYYSHMYRFQERHLFKTGQIFEGMIIGTDEFGRLAVEVDGSVKYFDIKEIEYII
ncbi:MAG: biotin--[acetyl-CoA-carboxylase] ligase [Cytophagaceae bacterium]